MKRFVAGLAMVLTMGMFVVAGAEDKGDDANAAEAVDTLVVTARVIEIPGTFPPNDLYNYVYVMKYRILKVHQGDYDGKEILVGQYNPLIARKDVKDKMDEYVDGDVAKFEEGAKHKLVLVKPIDLVWQEAVEDEYFDVDSDKYYALETNVAK